MAGDEWLDGLGAMLGDAIAVVIVRGSAFRVLVRAQCDRPARCKKLRGCRATSFLRGAAVR